MITLVVTHLWFKSSFFFLFLKHLYSSGGNYSPHSFNLDKYILRPNYWTVCLSAGICCLLPLKTDTFKPLEADVLLLLFLVVFCTEKCQGIENNISYMVLIISKPFLTAKKVYAYCSIITLHWLLLCKTLSEKKY